MHSLEDRSYRPRWHSNQYTAARAFADFSRKHYVDMKLSARIFHFLYDYIFHIQKFCAIIALVEHTVDPFNWVGVLLLYWISWVCSTFFMQKMGSGLSRPQHL